MTASQTSTSRERGGLSMEAAPGHSTVWERLALRAQEVPNRVALEWGDGAMSYQQLDALAAAIAAFLPVAPGTKPVVAIHGASSPAFIASLIGVMSRGAVALPIDDRLPPGRKKQMLEVARAGIVLSCSDVDQEVFAKERALSLDPSTCAIRDSRLGAGVLPGVADGFQDAAYIFLTSGTTGTPKAVLGRGASLDHFIAWQRGCFDIGPGDRCAQFTNLSFDPCLRDIFSVLTSGGTLLLPGASARASVATSLAFVAEKKPTLLHIVPTVARYWLRSLDQVPDALRCLRLTFFAGEPLSSDLVGDWRRAAPASSMVNLYGPTETTLARFYWRVPEHVPSSGSLPVGQPIFDTRAIVVDTDGRPAPAGEIGEILIDTMYPSLGYLEGEGDNARFCNPPDLVPRHGSAFFRTGDLGRMNADGDLTVIGRVDKQLKIAGVRLNPLEVAEAIKEHPAVKEAVVAASEVGGEKQLLAWYVVDPTAEPPSAASLRSFLRERLMAAVIPALFVPVGEMPMTSNGKVDLAALQELVPAARQAGTESAATATESAVCEIWASVLGVGSVGVEQDFFSMGGDSLKAAEATLEIRRRLQVALEAGDILDHPSPRALAAVIERRAGTSQPQAAPLPRTPSRAIATTYPLSPRQIAYKAICMPGRDVSWCILSRVVPFPTRPSEDDLRAAMATLIERHDALRMRFPDVMQSDTQEILPAGACDVRSIAIQQIDLRDRIYEESHGTVMEIRAAGSKALFDIAKWPLCKLAILSFADTCVVIVWVHHLIMDGPSLNIFVDELVAEVTSSQPVRELSETSSYLDYVDWCGRLDAAAAEQGRAYWRALLRGFQPLALPEDRSDPTSAQGRLYTEPFPPALVRDVLAASRHHGCTPFILLLVAYLKVLARVAGRSDIAVIIPVQTRPPPSFQRTIGLFFSQVVVRAEADALGGGGDWHRRIAAQVRDGQRYTEYEFHDRLADLGMEVRTYDYPLTTALFNQNRLASTLSYAGATPFGHHALGRDLRFQVQGEMQTIGHDFLISYLYRAGVFPTPGSIEAFSADVMAAAAHLCR